MISEHDNANGYPWTDPKSPYPRLRDYVDHSKNLGKYPLWSQQGQVEVRIDSLSTQVSRWVLTRFETI